MRLQEKRRTFTQNSVLISVQSEQLTRLKEYVAAFLTGARNEHHENTQHMIYVSFSRTPARWRNRAISLCGILLV